MKVHEYLLNARIAQYLVIALVLVLMGIGLLALLYGLSVPSIWAICVIILNIETKVNIFIEITKKEQFFPLK